MEAKESEYGKRLYISRRRNADPDILKEVWYEAQQLYNRLKESNLFWITPDQLEASAITELTELDISSDPVDALFAEATRNSTLGAALKKAFAPNQEAKTPQPVDTSTAKSMEELQALGRLIQTQLLARGFSTTARLRLSSILETFNEDPPAEDRVRIERELREFANNQGISLQEAPTSFLPEAKQFTAPVRETVPQRIRADEYRSLLN